ncbi:MAG: Mpo1-like protein [Janthinobacterium lividum]
MIQNELTYTEFWPRYLRAHARPITRMVHCAGTGTALILVGTSIFRRDWRFAAAAPLVGYGAAWGAHFGLEGNKPATFGHPVWSLLSDARMAVLMLTGRLGPHLDKAGAYRAPMKSQS